MTKILLCDNGSRNPAATLMLRAIANALSQQCGQTIEAVSLQHAGNIPSSQLNNQPAQVLTPYLQQQLTAGIKDFIILPLFFGNSGALTSYIPQQQELLEQQFGTFNIKLAEVLYPLAQGEPMMTEILYGNIQQLRKQQAHTAHAGMLDHVVLTDHGSPSPKVNEVRQRLALELQQRLGNNVQLSQAAMERRPGKQYDFNGELLEQWLLNHAQAGHKGAIVSMLFLLPGKHAGSGGDIATICQGVMQQYPDYQVLISPLVGDHPGLVELLNSRLQAVLKS